MSARQRAARDAAHARGRRRIGDEDVESDEAVNDGYDADDDDDEGMRRMMMMMIVEWM